MDGILTSIKKLLGIEEDYTHFDSDLIIYINSAILGLTQIGVGPADGFKITGTAETWIDFLGDSKMLEAAKTYIYLKVRILFDPPSSGTIVEAMKNTLSEIEWRLTSHADPVYQEG